MIQTKVSTDDSYININEENSLSLDSEEELDIEFSSTNLLSNDLIQKNSENKKDNHINIPHLDSRMINYNKSHAYAYTEKSLSRNLKFVSSDNEEDSADIIYENIKNMKQLIKSYKKKNKILEKKCNKYEGKIGKIALKLYSNKSEKILFIENVIIILDMNLIIKIMLTNVVNKYFIKILLYLILFLNSVVLIN